MSDEGLVINSVVLHPQRPDRIILGIEGDGVYVSNDRGQTFQRTSAGLHNLRITTVVADPFEKDRVYASVVFGGAASGIYRSDDAGRTWAKASHTALPEVHHPHHRRGSRRRGEVPGRYGEGLFWSSDAQEWTQAEPSSFPIRFDKIVRFNRTALVRRNRRGSVHLA